MRWRSKRGIFAWIAWLSLVAPAGAQDLPLEWNVRPKVAGLFAKLESGEVGVLAIVGDSISFKPDSYNWFLRDRFWADYGIAGDGYLATGPGFSGAGKRNAARDPIGFSTSGDVTLASVNGDRAAAGYSCPDGIFAQVRGTGRMDLTFLGTRARLHYVVQPGGGTMRLTLNGQPLLDIPTGGPPAHGAVTFDTGRGPDATSVLRIASADGVQVQTSGLDMRTGLSGLVYHRLARGGAGPLDFNRSDTPENAALLTELTPDVLIVMLDWARPEEVPTYFDELEHLLDYYTQTLPAVPIVLMSHHPFRDDIRQQAAWLYQIAQERDMGFINLFDSVPGGLAQMEAMGFMDGEVHLTATGGKWFGDYVYNLLKHDGTCQPPSIELQPEDVEVAEGSPVLLEVASPNAAWFQWRKDGQPVPGADQSEFQIAEAALEDAGTYDCLVGNDCETIASGAAVLTVTPGGQSVWWYFDADADGFGRTDDALFAEQRPDGYAPNGGDCDDADPAVHPGAEELLNGVDDDCDGVVDNGFEVLWYRDADGDGYGIEGDTLLVVQQPDGYSAQAGDCDDGNAEVSPAAVEIQNGVDDDCDGVIDDGFEVPWYRDADGDGYGIESEMVLAVQQPEGYSAQAGDCDDGNAAANPGEVETLNGIDDDCDGVIDDGFEVPWYRDADGDAYGLESEMLVAVLQPEGYTAQAGDCDDDNAAVNPGAEEVFDLIDNDCDGEIDENVTFFYYRDADGDGFGDAADMVVAGSPPEGYVIDASDCDDGNSAVNPGAQEVCDGVDNNCDGQTDENSGPVITQDPVGRSVRVGDTAEFGVTDVGGQSYQWRRNGQNIDGATGPVFTILNVRSADAGVYSVVVTNPCGEAVSAGARLRIAARTGPVVPGWPGGK